MATYGYTKPRYGGGYVNSPGRTKASQLSLAATGKRVRPSDPWFTDTTDSARVARANPPAAAPAGRTTPTTQTVTQPGGAAVNPNRQPVDTAPTPGVYDINTDPALQQVNALIGMNDEQAQAEAVKQKKQLLLEYGDPSLARAVLGEGDPTSEAAGQNQFSTRAQLGQQRDRNVHDLTEQLNNANLFYGGYRITQEEQAAKDYENQLAQAAAGANQGLDQISGNLSGALAQNQGQRVSALNDAYNRHATDAGTGDIDIAELLRQLYGDAGGGADDGTGGDPLSGAGGLTGAPRGPLTVDPEQFDPYRAALARAAASRRNVAL